MKTICIYLTFFLCIFYVTKNENNEPSKEQILRYLSNVKSNEILDEYFILDFNGKIEYESLGSVKELFNKKYNISLTENDIKNKLVMFYYKESPSVFKGYGIVNYKNKNYIHEVGSKYKEIDAYNENVFEGINSIVTSQSYLGENNQLNIDIKKVMESLNIRIKETQGKVLQLSNQTPNLRSSDKTSNWLMNFSQKYGIKKVYNKTKVAVIDSGFSRNENEFPTIKVKNIGKDDSSVYHGTGTAGVIFAINPTSDIIVYNVLDKDVNKTIKNTILAIKDAIKNDVAFINVSMSGSGYVDPEELAAYKAADDAGITVVVAAGNDGLELSENICNHFPACYKKYLSNMIVVGNIDDNGMINLSSNFGSIVDYYTNGTRVQTLYSGNSLSIATGTSISTPIVTGLLTQQISNDLFFLHSNRRFPASISKQ